MAKLSEVLFYGNQDLLQGYWQCPLAPDAQEIFHDRHARWTAHTYACPARNFELDLLLPSDALHPCWRGSIAWSGWTMLFIGGWTRLTQYAGPDFGAIGRG